MAKHCVEELLLEGGLAVVLPEVEAAKGKCVAQRNPLGGLEIEEEGRAPSRMNKRALKP